MAPRDAVRAGAVMSFGVAETRAPRRGPPRSRLLDPRRRSRPPWRQARSLALLVVLGVCWGGHVGLSKAVGAQDAQTALAYLGPYMALTAVALSAAALCRRRAPLRRRHLGYFGLAGCFSYFAPMLAELVAAPRVDAGLFVLIEALAPAMTAALAVAVALERVSARRCGAILLGALAGVALFLPEAAAGSANFSIWALVAFIVPVSYSISNVYVLARWPQEMGVLQVAAGEAVAGFLLSLGVAFAWGVDVPMMARAVEEGGDLILAMAAMAIVTAFLSVYLLRVESAVFVSFGGVVGLATGVLVGVFFFDERPSWGLWVACGLTLASLRLLRSAGGDGAAA